MTADMSEAALAARAGVTEAEYRDWARGAPVSTEVKTKIVAAAPNELSDKARERQNGTH